MLQRYHDCTANSGFETWLKQNTTDDMKFILSNLKNKERNER